MSNYVLENILLLFVVLVPIIASLVLRSTYSKYKKVSISNEMSGFEVARKILDENGLKDLYVVETTGDLTDHYDPKSKVVRLSTDIFHGKTIAAAAVAAHECGHALQDKENYTFMKIRSALVPVVNLVTRIAYVLFIISLLFQYMGGLYAAVVIVALGLVFQLVTLPVEFNASSRALKKIDEYKIVTKNEHDGTKKMLFAAAMTYVAALLSDVLNLARLLIQVGDRNKRR